MIKMILASTLDGGIGLDNKLPFHCPEDLQYFKEQTEGNIVVMGGKTFDCLPFNDGLPMRSNIILSKSKVYIGKRCLQLNSIQELFEYLNSRKHNAYQDVWIIGGGSVYEQLLPYVQELHHTIVKGDYECDTFVDINSWNDSIAWYLEDVKHLSDRAEVKIWRRY